MKRILKLSALFLAFYAIGFAQVNAQTTYGFESQAEFDGNFTSETGASNNTIGIFTTQSQGMNPKVGSGFLQIKNGKGNTDIYFTTKKSFSNISNIGFWFASSDKGKTTITIEISSDNTFSSGTTKVIDGKVLADLGVSSPSNKVWYEISVPVNNLSGYVRFSVTASSSGKYWSFDELVISSGGTPPTPASTDATLSDIKVDGKSITGFNANTTSYTYEIPAAQSALPQVSATATDSKASVNITQTSSESGKATIDVTAEDGTTKNTYTIQFSKEITSLPTITGFVVNGVNATINPNTKKITATLPIGSSLTNITPTVTIGGSATDYSPKGAQNFSSPVTYTATDASQNTPYTVELTVATPSSNATLSDIKIGGISISGFNASTTTYTYTVPIGQSVPQVEVNSADGKAKIQITQAESINGTATIVVTAEDGVTKKTYIIQFSQAAAPPMPSTTLTPHEPELYETPKPLGGYGTDLTIFQDREWEVFYTVRGISPSTGATGPVVSTRPATGSSTKDAPAAYMISTNETATSFESKENWFKGSGLAVGSQQMTSIAPFNGYTGDVRMQDDATVEICVKGYDRFCMLALDKNTQVSKGQYFEVYIDGEKQEMTLSSSLTLREFDINTNPHVIKIVGKGNGKNCLHGFALRVSNEPRVKYVAGDDKDQVVNQTKDLSPITYALKNAGTLKLGWIGAEATGVTLTPINAAGDTAKVSGTVMAPVGTYTYKVIGVNPSGVEASYSTGTFRVQTEVRVADGSLATSTVWINDAMEPIVFDYDAINEDDINLNWTTTTPAGVTFTKDNTAKTLSITGTPTTSGAYPFTVVAAGGNTIDGMLNVEVPAPLLSTEDTIKKAKATEVMQPIVWNIKFATNATVTGLPNGVTGTYDNGTFTISGTPATETSYPKTYTYTISTTPLYTEKPATSATGKLIVLDPNAQSILYLYKSTYESAVYTYLNTRYDVTVRPAADILKTDADYAFYDVIAISETVDAINPEVLDIIRFINKPILNFKSFTYTNNRLAWGTPDNGLITNKAITVKQPGHPIFKGFNSALDSSIELLTNIDTRGIQPADVTLEGSICLAVAPKRETSEMATAIHDVPAEVRGTGITSKYILIPISTRSHPFITNNAKKLIDNALNYLVDGAQYAAPNLEIKTFTVNGIAATINHENNTITAIMPDGTDLSALQPIITLTGVGTTVSPASGETVNFTDIYHGVDFTVSDMINTKVYNVKLRTLTGLNDKTLKNVYFDGKIIHNEDSQRLYVFDVFGRCVVTSNTDINLSDCSHGVYLIKGKHGVMKVVR